MHIKSYTTNFKKNMTLLDSYKKNENDDLKILLHVCYAHFDFYDNQ